MRIEVIQAWPRRHETATLELPEGAIVSDALAAAGFEHREAPAAVAIHGEIVPIDHPLRDGDRVELLRQLLLDPKEARRRRAVK